MAVDGRGPAAHVGVRLQFRQQRVWGDAPSAPIGDRPADAIVPRLTALLRRKAIRPLAIEGRSGSGSGYKGKGNSGPLKTRYEAKARREGRSSAYLTFRKR